MTKNVTIYLLPNMHLLALKKNNFKYIYIYNNFFLLLLIYINAPHILIKF